jgi:hypothetical protein
MRQMKKKRRRKVRDCSGADKVIVYSYPNREAPTKVELLLSGRDYARELNMEIISLCEKHFRYGG